MLTGTVVTITRAAERDHFRIVGFSVPKSVQRLSAEPQIMQRELRRDLRFLVVQPGSLTLSIGRASDDPSEDQSGLLLDLSREGARLGLQMHVPAGERIRMRISSAEFSHAVESEATVSWVEPGSSSEWVIGCVLEDLIGQDLLDDLATAGMLDRRSEERIAVSFAAEAKTELERSFVPVEIVDTSDGGFCVVTDELSAATHDRLMLQIRDESGAGSGLMRGRVVWVNEMVDGRVIGCTFLTRADHEFLRKACGREKRDQTASRPQAATNWAAVAVAILLIILIHTFLL